MKIFLPLLLQFELSTDKLNSLRLRITIDDVRQLLFVCLMIRCFCSIAGGASSLQKSGPSRRGIPYAPAGIGQNRLGRVMMDG